MEDKTWIKRHLEEYFLTIKDDARRKELINTKLKFFDGKLYKYYSFEDPYSLKNIYDKTIHFSKPERFNDPFDCALGFSLDKAVAAFLPSVIDTKLELKGENGDQTKEIIKQLLLANKTDTRGDKTAELFKFLLSKPKFKELIEKNSRGGFSSESDFNRELLKLLSEPKVLLGFLELLQKPGCEDIIKGIDKDTTAQILIKPLLENPKAIGKFIPNSQITPDIEKGINIIEGISSEESVTNKIVKLAELTGEGKEKLVEEFERIRKILLPLLEDTKKKVNNTFAISCFSEKSDSILMWSHYANKHTGFCVEYDLTRCASLSAKLMLFPVIYSDERPTIPMNLVDFSNPGQPKVADASACIPDLVVSLLTKSKIWEYENEWRIIEMQPNLIDGHLLREDMISKVYLGANISSKNEEALRKALKSNIAIEKYKIDTDNYKLVL